MRILVVDDHAVVRQGLVRMLREEPDIEVAGEAANGQMAIELTRHLLPDVILMDVSMPVMGGVEATRAIHAEWPEVRVIGLSMFEASEQAEIMRQAGAVQYLSKHESLDVILEAIRGSAAPGSCAADGQTK
jgi:two-component system, NarL family, response regulator LiaR